MKKHIALIGSVLCGVMLFAQQKMMIYKEGDAFYQHATSDVDSVKFSGSNIFINETGGAAPSFSIAGIDSVTFEPTSDTIFVTFDGSSVSVNNYRWANVSCSINGANV